MSAEGDLRGDPSRAQPDELAGPFEHGSDFHVFPYRPGGPEATPWRSESAKFYGSGRDAMRHLLRFGVEQRGWKRLLVPDYFCQQVTAALLGNGLQVETYPIGPGEGSRSPIDTLASWGPGDVLLIVNFFGLECPPVLPMLQRRQFEVIEDHTHDPLSPWAHTSGADWCVASLRKTLPLPDGGVLWSPQGHPGPQSPELDPQHQAIALQRFAAMSLKAQYLAGAVPSKLLYRDWMVSTEGRIGSGSPSSISPLSALLLSSFPLQRWREQRGASFAAFCEAFGTSSSAAQILTPVAPGACPLGAVLVLESRRVRDLLRQALISQDVYPAVLWPLDAPVLGPSLPRHVDLSERMLALACDMRYGPRDMQALAALVLTTLERISGSTEGA